MPIEFRCTQCEKLLRTGDDTAGKRAKCPQCGNIQTVPAAGTPPAPAAGAPAPGPPKPGGEPSGSPFGPGGQQPPSGGDPENPYQSPTRTAAAATPPSQPTGGITPTQLDMGEVFNRTWEIFKEQWGACLLAVLAVMGIALAAYVCW